MLLVTLSYQKMLRFFSVAEAQGLIYPRPSSEISGPFCSVFTCVRLRGGEVDY